MKKIFAVLMSAALALTVAFGVAACGKGDTLRVGYTIYPPMNYTDEQGNFVGFDTELALETGKILGKEIEFVEIVWDNKIFDLNTGNIDIVWNGMTITDELKENMEISEPYLENRQVVVCQISEAEKYKTKDDLVKASEIIVEKGSAGASAVGATSAADKIRTADAQKDTLLEVKTSASKIAVIDYLMAQVIVGEGTDYSDLTFVDVGFEDEQFGIGFKKGNTELCEQVNNAIKTLKEKGKFAEIQAKYYG